MVFFKCKIGGDGPPTSNGGLTYTEGGDLGYCPVFAELLAYCSAWSYSDRDVFLAKLEQKPALQGADFMEISVVNDAMFIVSYAQIIRTADKKRIIVCFRGTEIANLVSWLTDAGTRKVSFPDDTIKVHSGFWRNWNEVWEGQYGVEAHLLEPRKLAKNHKYDTNNSVSSDTEQDLLEEIFFTGHSLGGAAALISALDVQFKNNILWSKLKGVYTYGQPMVVGCDSRAIAEGRIGHKLYRFVYYNDLIPHLPPLSTGAFDHNGKEFKYIPRAGVWRLRNGQIDNILIRPRTTQVLTVLGAAPFALADCVLYNVQWFNFVKMPWSAIDHAPYFYVDSFNEEHPGQDNSCVIQ